jgi:hypothetical protein
MRIFKVAIFGKPEIGCRESKIRPPDAVVIGSGRARARAPRDYLRGPQPMG